MTTQKNKNNFNKLHEVAMGKSGLMNMVGLQRGCATLEIKVGNRVKQFVFLEA